MSVTPQEVEDLRPLPDRRACRDRRGARASSCGTSRRTARSTTWRSAIGALADAIARAVARLRSGPSSCSVCPARSCSRAAEAAGLAVAAEGFADRAYEPDGSLTPRSRAGRGHPRPAPRSSAGPCAWPTTASSPRPTVSRSRCASQTICTHGDTPGSHELTRALARGLERAGIAVRAVGRRDRGRRPPTRSRLVERGHARRRGARSSRRDARVDARRVRRHAVRAGAAGHPRRVSGLSQRPAACLDPSRSSRRPPAASAFGWICRSVRPHARADAERRCSTRSSPPRAGSRRTSAQFVVVPHAARPRHGRRVGERRRAGLGDVARRASRQGARR